MRHDNDDEVETITLMAAEVDLLVAAADLLTQMWGELDAGKPFTMDDLTDRMVDLGIAWDDGDRRGVSPDLTAAIVSAAEALDGGYDDAPPSYEVDVSAAERAFSP